MRFVHIIGALCLSTCATPVHAQVQAPQTFTVYEDMRLICGHEGTSAWRVRVMAEARKLRASLEKQGFNVNVVRLTGRDSLPAGAPTRTYSNCLND